MRKNVFSVIQVFKIELFAGKKKYIKKNWWLLLL